MGGRTLPRLPMSKFAWPLSLHLLLLACPTSDAFPSTISLSYVPSREATTKQYNIGRRKTKNKNVAPRLLVLRLDSTATTTAATRTTRTTTSLYPYDHLDTDVTQQNTDDDDDDDDTRIILSDDPLVYLAPDLLSKEECLSYIDYVKTLESTKRRELTLSNPPQVSLQVGKLWPLPLLSLLAGIPPLIRMMQDDSHDNGDTASLLRSVLTSANIIWDPIAKALMGSFALAFLVLQVLRSVSERSSRTSEAMALNSKEDAEFVNDLVTRVSDLTDHPPTHWEAPVVTRYRPGAIFARHGDASPTGGSEWSDVGGQRVVTCICYLNDVRAGGETSFDRLNIAVRPTQGRALVFFPADPQSLRADDRTIHESLPAFDEEKWIVQMFGRVGQVPPPLGLPESSGVWDY